LAPTTTPRPFPYTTLFRSVPANRWLKMRLPFAGIVALKVTGVCDPPYVAEGVKVNLTGAGDETLKFLIVAAVAKPLAWFFEIKGDRKSTRLNSSHVKISHA